MSGTLTINIVEPGTEIEHKGEKLTVTDSEAVQKNGTIYITEKTYAAMKQRPSGKAGQACRDDPAGRAALSPERI